MKKTLITSVLVVIVALFTFVVSSALFVAEIGFYSAMFYVFFSLCNWILGMSIDTLWYSLVMGVIVTSGRLMFTHRRKE